MPVLDDAVENLLREIEQGKAEKMRNTTYIDDNPETHTPNNKKR